MSNEMKKALLNDDELEKIGGGLTFSVSSVEFGDVFIAKHNPNEAYVISDNVIIIDNNTEVPFVSAFKSESGWEKTTLVMYKPIHWFFDVANYSSELSKRI